MRESGRGRSDSRVANGVRGASPAPPPASTAAPDFGPAEAGVSLYIREDREEDQLRFRLSLDGRFAGRGLDGSLERVILTAD